MFNRLLRITVLTCIAVVLSFSAAACVSGVEGPSAPTQAPDAGVNTGEEADPRTLAPVPASDKFSVFDTTIAYDPDKCTKITLSDGATSVSGDGAEVSGDVITVKREGDYLVSGTLSDGQIVVSVEKTEKVRLILNGANITNKTQAAIYVTSADKVCVTLASGTVNTLTDGTKYTGLNEKNEPTACLFCKDDLTINGYGALVVNGNYNNGIATKNDLKIVSGSITVNARNNAIKGKDSFQMNSGTLVVNSDDDGIKVNEDSNVSKGFISIEGGTITITAGDDALTAVYSVTVTGGTITTYAGGKAVNCSGTVSIKEGCLIEK